MADYPNILIDVSAKDIENLINNPIPDSKLELKYWENQNLFSVGYYSTLDSLLQAEYDKTKGNSKTIFRLKFTGTFPEYHILGNKEYVAISDSKSTQLILLDTETGKRYLYKKGEQTIADINAIGNFWNRKNVSADSWAALDTIVRTGSSDYEIYVLTLGPDLFEVGMSYKPLIAFIDGKNNGNILMMDMGNGSWWQFKYGDSYITRVEPYVNKDFEYIGYQMTLANVADKATSGNKLYLTGFDGQTIDGINVPDEYLLVKRSGNILKLTTAISDGKVYTYNIEAKTLTVEYIAKGGQDFIHLSDFLNVNTFFNYEFEVGKMYMFACVSDKFEDIGVPVDYYTGYKFGGGSFIFSKIFSDGKVYRLDLDTKTVTVELGYLCNEQFSTMNELVTYHANIPFLKDKLYLIYFDGEFSSLGLPEGLYQCGYEREVLGVLEYLHATPVNANGKNYVIDIIEGEVTSSDIVFDRKLTAKTGEYRGLTIPEAVNAIDTKIESAIEYIGQVQDEYANVEERVANIENTLNGLETLLASI